MGKDASGVRHSIKGGTNGNEVGENLIGLMKAMAEEKCMDLGEFGSRIATVEKTKNFPLNLSQVSAHVFLTLFYITLL